MSGKRKPPPDNVSIKRVGVQPKELKKEGKDEK
jgi:hypothetical protein